MIKKIVFSLLVLGISSAFVKAQKTPSNTRPLSLYHSALELFNKEKYACAQDQFTALLKITCDYPIDMNLRASYYNALCGLLLSNGDAENLSMYFLKKYPDNPLANNVYLQLARYYFNNRMYGKAATAFGSVEVSRLNQNETSEYYFKLGYCYFTENDYEKAKTAFYAIIDKESVYYAPANYYFAHLAYTEAKYETALKSFLKLKDDEQYGKIAPYYLIQIYHMQGKYDEVIALGPSLAELPNEKRNPEIIRMIAEAYYQTERYHEAIPYIEMYLQKATAPLSDPDQYMIGFSYYKISDYTRAIDFLNKINTSEDDSLAQLTLYHLAECYLKSDQKTFAMNMFSAASKMTANTLIQENAMFNYAKLAYETSYNPYNEAVKVLNEYLEKYPDSKNTDEVYEYLSGIYLSTRNYKEALSALEKISKRSPKLNAAYQKIAYMRGVELFNNNDFTASIDMFDKSLEYPVEQQTELLCNYWKGEAYYRLGKFDSAMYAYHTAQAVPGAYLTNEYLLCYYGLGYCYFKKSNFMQALPNFKKMITENNKLAPELINDATNRAADCYFMNKDFSNAITCYDDGIKMKLRDTDYALYQKALAQGALAKFEAKAATLIYLVDQYKSSVYVDDALFELGGTYQNMGNNAKAIEYYDLLVKDFPLCSYVSQSLLRKGLIYYNEQKDQQALDILKQVVNQFPATPESKEALVSIRNIYVDMDNVDGFFLYVKDLPFASVSDTEQDSITYIAVENRYMNNDCENAIKGFNNYLEKFPNGFFVTNARFYLAECQFKSGKSDEALLNYNFIITQPRNKFTETALLNAADINFGKKNYEAALSNYSDLEKFAEYNKNITIARIGLMRCNFNLQLYNNAIASARILLTTDKISEDLLSEAHLIIAKSALATDSLTLALGEFMTVTHLTKSEMGAEAKYNVAYIQYLFNSYTESEKTAFDLINSVPSYDYWVAKAFILLADIYVKTGNLKQAKYTLKSIIDNYEGADLVQLAQEKLNAINETERLEELRKAEELLKIQQQNNQQINFDNETGTPDQNE